MVKISLYVPESHLEIVKAAMFAAGGGNIGDYEQCCWQAPGMGQFRPKDSSQPFIGERGQLEQFEEYLVDMVCEEHLVAAVVKALRGSHPYEEPAFGIYQMLDVDQFDEG